MHKIKIKSSYRSSKVKYSYYDIKACERSQPYYLRDVLMVQRGKTRASPIIEMINGFSRTMT